MDLNTGPIMASLRKRDLVHSKKPKNELLPDTEAINAFDISVEEIGLARRDIARQIWLNCAEAACRMNSALLNIAGRPEADLTQIAKGFDSLLKVET
jgi:hypothetical protein